MAWANFILIYVFLLKIRAYQIHSGAYSCTRICGNSKIAIRKPLTQSAVWRKSEGSNLYYKETSSFVRKNLIFDEFQLK